MPGVCAKTTHGEDQPLGYLDLQNKIRRILPKRIKRPSDATQRVAKIAEYRQSGPESPNVDRLIDSRYIIATRLAASDERFRAKTIALAFA